MFLHFPAHPRGPLNTKLPDIDAIWSEDLLVMDPDLTAITDPITMLIFLLMVIMHATKDECGEIPI